MRGLLCGVLAMAAVSGQAAVKSFPVKINQPIVDYGRRHIDRQSIPFGFSLSVISDSRGILAESSRNGRPSLAAEPGEHYAIELYNPLPVRAAVNLTVDGLNSISGKPSGIADGEKWIIEPYSRIRLSGWQVSQGEARRFFFTDKPKSYNAWRGATLGKDMTANCGVIGAAFFWNQKELDAFYAQYPVVRERPPMPFSKKGTLEGAAESERRNVFEDSVAGLKRQEAGTGMGERVSHPTYEVEFTFDRGMYKASEALVVYYDFARTPAPNPFPALSFAPEMP